MTDFIGTTGDDHLIGGVEKDNFDISQGGSDTVEGMAGNDAIYAGGALDASDRIDGGTGWDTLYFSGDYWNGLKLGPDTVRNVETLYFSGGFDASIKLSDGTIAAGAIMQVNTLGLLQHDRLVVNGSAETDGGFQFDIGQGDMTLIGGQGNDHFNMDSPLSSAIRLDGGGGDDLLSLRGDLQSHYVFKGAQLRDIDWIVTNGDRVTLTVGDKTVAEGETMKVSAGEAGIDFDGSAEKGGAFELIGSDIGDRFVGGDGADYLRGWGGDDTLIGGLGADQLYGGDGADTFAYLALDGVTKKTADHIFDLTNEDVIDLSKIDADVGAGGNQAFVLVKSFDHHAGEAVLSYASRADQTILKLDVDGDGVADTMILIDGDHRDFTNFVL